MRLLISFFTIMVLTAPLLAPHGSMTSVVAEPDVTTVSGVISGDTTWSGNILVTWPGVIVAEGSTLTVEPGTTVRFQHWRHGYADPDARIGLGIHGTLKAIGTPEKPIRFTSDAPDPEHDDWWGISFIITSTHSIIDHCIIEYANTGVSANHANFTLSNSIVRWSTGANVYLLYSSPNITHNRLYENSHGIIELGRYSNPTITYNTMCGSTAGGIFSTDYSHPIIRHNIIRNCSGGIGIMNFGAATIEYNTITGTELGIEIRERTQPSEVTIKYNNLYGNKNVNVQTDSTLTDDVDATNNWWGTTDRAEIEAKIMDSRRDPALRTVFYEPYLTSIVDIGVVVYDFENNETYAHLPGTENDTYLYIYPDDDTRKIVGSWHPFDFPTGIAWEGEHLWIANEPGKTLCKFDTSLRLIDSFPCPATAPYGLAFDGEYLWLMEYLNPLVYQLDLSGEVIKSIPAPREHCMGLAWDGSYFWTMSGEEAGESDYKLCRFDASGNIAAIIRTGLGRAASVAWDGEHLWAVNTGDDMIYEIEPSDGRIIRSITTPGDRTFGMVWQGQYLWCTDWTNEQTGSGRVFKIMPLEERMTIDGLKDDWLDFIPLIYDPEGDNVKERTADIRSVYGFTDYKYLYLMTDFYNLDQYDHVEIEMDFNADGDGDYLLQPSADQTFVGFTDLRGGEAKSWTRSNRLFIPYSNVKEVYEARIPLAFIENRSQLYVRVLMLGEEGKIDETGWVYVGREGLASIISCTLSKPEITIGDAVTISGYISPPFQAPVSIQYSVDNGVTWLNLTRLLCASNGSYSYVWSPTSIGSYQLKASWEGDAAHLGATSNTVGVKVTKIPTAISCSVSPSEVTEGNSISVSGSINPAVPDRTVILTYRKPDGTTFTRTATTASDGSYRDSFKPTPKGSWTVTASWAGDAEYSPAESQTVTLTVTKPKTPTMITCTASPTSLLYGESVKVKGQMTPAVPNATVSLRYVRPDGSSFKEVVQTDSNGAYSHEYIPDHVGSWSVEASWPGNDQYLEATSATAPFMVTKVTTTISVSVSKTTIMEGDEVTVSGAVKPSPGQVPVTLTYATPDGLTLNRTVTSSLEGLFSEAFEPTLKGSWSVTASWRGSETHEGAVSEPASFTVRILTTISTSVSKTAITEGDEITVSGSIEPTPGVVGVTLTYTKPDGTTLSRTVTTSGAGAYTDTWKPVPKGSWSVAASWAGSEAYEGATSSTASFTVKEKACIIATATYGSELSPEVQYLRAFRNEVVLSTFAGSQFMQLFNAWYYSFSPGVAGFIAENQIVRLTMRAVLYPLMGALHVSSLTYSLFSFNKEVGVMMAGLVATGLIGVVHFSPLVTAMVLVSKRLRKVFRMDRVKLLSIPWLISLALILIGEASLSPTIMTVATGIFVLTTLSLSATATAVTIVRSLTWRFHF